MKRVSNHADQTLKRHDNKPGRSRWQLHVSLCVNKSALKCKATGDSQVSKKEQPSGCSFSICINKVLKKYKKTEPTVVAATYRLCYEVLPFFGKILIKYLE